MLGNIAVSSAWECMLAYGRACARACACMCVYVFVCACVRVRARLYACMRVYARVYAYMRAYMRACACTCAHQRAHSYLCVFLEGCCCCCCCSHINSHNQVRGHRTGSSHSGAEEYPREKHTQPKVVFTVRGGAA